MGNLVPILGVVPKPAHIFDLFAIMADQDIVKCDDALIVVSGAAVFLQRLQTPFVELFHVPGDLSQNTVEARLVRCFGELSANRRD